MKIQEGGDDKLRIQFAWPYYIVCDIIIVQNNCRLKVAT